MTPSKSFTKFNYAQLDMLHEVVNHSKEEQATTDLVPQFKDTIVKVDGKIKSIDLIIAPRSSNNTGIAGDKQSFKQLLAEVIFSVTNPVAGYCASINDETNEKKLGLSFTTIRTKRDTAITSYASNVIEIVTPMLPQIVSTGITQQTLDSIKLASDTFYAVATSPRNAKVVRRQLTETIVAILADAMNITTRTLDRSAIRFKAIDQNAYYLQYKAARKLQPYGNTHTRADVTVTMGDSGVIMDALVQIEGTSLKKFTDKDGKCTISPTPVGKRKLIVTAPGFPNPVITQEYTFRRGKATKITVSMTEFNIPAPQQSKQKANA